MGDYIFMGYALSNLSDLNDISIIMKLILIQMIMSYK